MMSVKGRQYGTVFILRGICPECGEECIVCSDGTSACCSKKMEPYKLGRITKETYTGKKANKKKPSAKAQEEILEKQNNKCYWCEHDFDTMVVNKKGRVYILKPNWDHYIPYAYTGSCHKSQFVAACRICNSSKSDKLIFNENDEKNLSEYLKRRWYKLGWEDV